jgi:1-deoxy-D-xylulose-5-phosphate reductoisomerase
MNKGLEVIEARWLFDVPAERIEVVIHPESVIHSMVSYVDGSVIAQLGNPDMRTPIAYGLAYPERISAGVGTLDLAQIGTLHFEAPDVVRFPCLRLAQTALNEGGSAPVVLNAANEIAVEAFLSERIGFLAIAEIVEAALARVPNQNPDSLEHLGAIDNEARGVARALVEASK